jgi:predicted DNA-binding ribbon-helix-helix protein
MEEDKEERNQMTKTKSKKRSLKPNSTSDLVGALRVITEHIALEQMSNDDKLTVCFLLTEVADRMSALVDLTVRQNKRIIELEASR